MSAKGWLQDFEDEKEDREPEKRPPFSAGMTILSSEAEAAKAQGWSMIPRYGCEADRINGKIRFYQLTEKS